MDKAADNERLRLRASYYNNIAAGLVVASLLILWAGAAMIAETASQKIAVTVVAFGLALFGAIVFHKKAGRRMAKLRSRL